MHFNKITSFAAVGLILFVYAFSLSTKSFDRVLQVSVILGFGLGYLSHIRQPYWPKKWLLIFSLLLPVIVLLLAWQLGFIRLNIRSVGMFSAGFYVPMLLGLLLTKIKIAEGYKNAILLGVLLVFLSALTRKMNHGTSASITIFLTILGAIMLSKNRPGALLKYQILFGGVYVLLHLILGNFPDTLQMAFLDVSVLVSALFVGLVMQSASTAKTRLFKIGAFAAVFMAMVWFGQQNYEKWFFARQGNIEITEAVSYHFETNEGKVFSSENMHGKKMAVLFWSASCSNCSKEFPYFSSLAQRYTSDSSVVFLAAFLSYTYKDSSYYNQITRQHFQFQWAKAIDSRKLMDELQIQGVPQMTIFNKENIPVYNGLVSNRPWIWVNRPALYLND